MSNYTAVEAEEATRRAQAVTELIENLGKPVIAAVNGFALGGGCELAMACTFRIASETAKFGQPEVKIGIMPGARRNPTASKIGRKGQSTADSFSRAKSLMRQEAYRIGLVNEVVPAANLIARAEAILNQINCQRPAGCEVLNRSCNKGLDAGVSEGLLIEASLFGICAGSEDKKEGTSAFLAKRAPQFRGR